MFNSLQGRLWITNTIIIAVAVILIILCINLIAIFEFNDYKVKDLDRTYQDIYEIVKEQYRNGTWDVWILEEVGADVLTHKKVLIALYGSNGSSLYDSAVTIDTAVTASNIHHGSRGMHGRGGWNDWGENPYSETPNSNSSANTPTQIVKGYNEKLYEIVSNGIEVGTLVLASTEQYDANDLNYLNRITQITIVIGVIAMGFTIFASNIFSGRISRQISVITNTATDISKGDYGKTVDEKTKISELRNLTLALNNLSNNLERHEKLRKRLTQDIAHELRTPISTMSGKLEAVLDGVWEMDIERVKTFYDEVQRLSRLVSDLYNLSKYENTVLNMSSFDIRELLQHVIFQFEAVLHDKKIQTNINIEPVSLYADKDKLLQVFINLLSNAVKFTHEHGNIQINAAKSSNGNKLRISIRDSGIGILDEDKPYIFERFYRADKSRNRKSGGAGIGLSIAKTVVEAHDGNISVNSEIGNFTEFIVELPLS